MTRVSCCQPPRPSGVSRKRADSSGTGSASGTEDASGPCIPRRERTTTTLTNAALVPEARWLIDRYEFLAELGRGGMGIVYLARDLASSRPVAIKLLGTSYAGNADAALRFAREARTVAALEHPHIVRTLVIEELGDGAIAIVSEYIPGQTLRALLRETGRLSFDHAASLLRDIASALAHAHRFRIVHRDVKPENIFVEHNTGRALLADFGIARPLDSDTLLTATGSSLGTPSYMAPEQVKGERLDERVDVYSLGLVGWETLAGSRPWEGETLYDVLHKQQHEQLPSLAELRPDIPLYLLRAIEGAVGKLPEERWTNGEELLKRLTPTPASLPPRRARTETSLEDEPTLPVQNPSDSLASHELSARAPDAMRNEAPIDDAPSSDAMSNAASLNEARSNEAGASEAQSNDAPPAAGSAPTSRGDAMHSAAPSILVPSRDASATAVATPAAAAADVKLTNATDAEAMELALSALEIPIVRTTPPDPAAEAPRSAVPLEILIQRNQSVTDKTETPSSASVPLEIPIRRIPEARTDPDARVESYAIAEQDVIEAPDAVAAELQAAPSPLEIPIRRRVPEIDDADMAHFDAPSPLQPATAGSRARRTLPPARIESPSRFNVVRGMFVALGVGALVALLVFTGTWERLRGSGGAVANPVTRTDSLPKPAPSLPPSASVPSSQSSPSSAAPPAAAAPLPDPGNARSPAAPRATPQTASRAAPRSAPPTAPRSAPTTVPRTTTRTPAATSTPVPAPPVSPPVASPEPAVTAESRCNIPTAAAQRVCLIAGINRNDVDLNATYQALIAQLRREAGGIREPRAVLALRVEQRAWVDDRDRACRSSGDVATNPRWGAERIPCFARKSEEREAELRQRLRARTLRDSAAYRGRTVSVVARIRS